MAYKGSCPFKSLRERCVSLIERSYVFMCRRLTLVNINFNDGPNDVFHLKSDVNK